jgi:hypothetical protein
MSQSRYDLDLSKEPVSADRCAEVGMKDFDCDGASVANVVSKIDASHPSPADLTLD